MLNFKKLLNKIHNFMEKVEGCPIIRIKITKDDIEKGDWYDEERDPICLAILKYLKKDCSVTMDYHIIIFESKTTREILKVSEELLRKIKLNKNLKPCTVNIHIPVAFLEPLETHNVS